MTLLASRSGVLCISIMSGHAFAVVGPKADM